MIHSTPLAPEAPAAREAAPCVYYDGGCPLCSREIATYRSARGGEQLQWVDAQACAVPELGPALPREAALRRLHVRLPDGQLVSGAAAFVAIWQRLPAFRGLALLARVPGMLWLMEGLYRAFLQLRPLWRAAPVPKPQAIAWESWPVALRRELRTDHAGEAGAVMIYRGWRNRAHTRFDRAVLWQHFLQRTRGQMDVGRELWLRHRALALVRRRAAVVTAVAAHSRRDFDRHWSSALRNGDWIECSEGLRERGSAIARGSCRRVGPDPDPA